MQYRYWLLSSLIMSSWLMLAIQEQNGEQLHLLHMHIKEGNYADLLDNDFEGVSPYDLERLQQCIGYRREAIMLVRWMHDAGVTTYLTEMKVKIARNKQIESELYNIASDVEEPVHSPGVQQIASKLSEIDERARARAIRNTLTPEETFVQGEKKRLAELWFWEREKTYEQALELLVASQRSHIWEHVNNLQHKIADMQKNIRLTFVSLDAEEKSLQEVAVIIDKKLSRDWKKVYRDSSISDDELKSLVCTYVRKTEQEKQAIRFPCTVL